MTRQNSRNHLTGTGGCCPICGAHPAAGICYRCQSAVTAFKRAWGHDPNLVETALIFLKEYGLQDLPETASPVAGEKRCARCGVVKALTEFYHWKGRPISYCKPCNAEYHQLMFARKKSQGV